MSGDRRPPGESPLNGPVLHAAIGRSNVMVKSHARPVAGIKRPTSAIIPILGLPGGLSFGIWQAAS